MLVIGSIAALATLAYLDVRQEEGAALEEFARDQAVVARTLVEQLEERLLAVRKDAALIAEATKNGQAPSMTVLTSYVDMRQRDVAAPRLLLAPPSSSFVLSAAVPEHKVVDLVLPLTSITMRLSSFERPGTQALLLLAPGDAAFWTMDGRRFPLQSLADAVRSGATSRQLTREEAASLGLPRRIAVAGLAAVEAGELGRWGIAAVTSAERLRDRESRARTRVVFGVLAAGSLVAAFGALALKRQRRELELSRELAVAAVERDHEARLDQAGRAATLGTLAMGIAHEISTPAGVIQGRAEQMLARASDERSIAAARAIADQANRITQVVKGFLDLARGDARAAELVEVAAHVHGATALVEHRFTKARVELRIDLPDDLPMLRGDARLLEHALTNLLLNSCDACAPGEDVVVVAHVLDDFLSIEVADDGAGISAEHVAHVMEPFFTTKEEGNGTGLGLAITSEIIRAHRGSLKLAPREPRGTTATIALPLSTKPNPEAMA